MSLLPEPAATASTCVDEIDDVEAIAWTWNLPDGAPDLAQARRDIHTLLAVIAELRERIAHLEAAMPRRRLPPGEWEGEGL